MKIALLHDLLDRRGGAERTLLSVAHHLQERGHEVTVFTLIFDESRTFTELVEPVKVREVGALRELLSHSDAALSPTRRQLRRIFGRLDPAQQFYLVYALQAFSRLDLGDYDIVHASNYPASNAAALIKKRQNVPAVWGCNEPYRDLWLSTKNAEPLLSKVADRTVGSLLRQLDLRLVSFLDAIYVNSKYTESLIKQIYDRTATVIYPGIDTELYSSVASASESKRQHCTEEEKMILTVSRLYPAKNIDTLIRAIRQLKDRGEKARLLIVGEGPEKDRLQNLAYELELSREIMLVSSVSDAEMLGYFAAADAFAFAAVDEPWGLVVLEAMACGIPVVVPSTGGPSESVQDGVTGLQVTGKDPSEYAEKLETILGDKRLADRIGQAGRSRVQREFNIERMVDSLEQFYLRAIEK